MDMDKSDLKKFPSLSRKFRRNTEAGLAKKVARLKPVAVVKG